MVCFCSVQWCGMLSFLVFGITSITRLQIVPNMKESFLIKMRIAGPLLQESFV